MLFIFAYLLLGAVSGVMAGLLGVGGGLIIVPSLLFLFGLQGFSDAVAMHIAIGTSLAAVTVTAISSARAHHKKGTVEWRIWQRLAPGLVVGSLLGAFIADLLPASVLRQFFGIFELAVAVHIARGAQPQPRQFPSSMVTGLVAAAIGVVCSLVGIGGGIMVVPFLVWTGLQIKNAVSTSAAAGLPIALAGAVGFLVLGSDASSLPNGSTGYVYWPALFGIAATSIFTAPYGAKLAHALSPETLRKVFAAFLAILGCLMLLGL